MPGSNATSPAPELPPGRRFALVVSTETYADPSLRRLRAPARDAADMREVLGNPDIGGFTVTSVTDRTAQEVRLAMEEFALDRQPDDLLVVYLSCHGLVDLRRRLYFVATDTRKDRLAATGVEAQWLLDQLEDCRARRQVVILDCCFSGAFAQGAKGDADLGLGERFHGHGRGRVVLTASRGSEYSFEGEPVAGSAMPGSVFTSALVAGLRTGAADLDRDGYVSVEDAYAYAFDQVRESGAEQTPQRWLYGAEGSIVLARNPTGVPITPAPRPDALRSAPGPSPTGVPAPRDTDGRSGRVSVPGRSHSRRSVGYVVGILAVVAVAALGAFLLLDDPETPGRPPAGDIVTDGPWRLLVRDTTSLNEGCAVTLTHTETGRQFSREQIYNTEVVQVPLGGTFHPEVNDRGCELVERDGSGDVALPFEWDCCVGDTDSFEPPAEVGIEVLDFNGNSECAFELHDAEDGSIVELGDTRRGDTIVLQPATAGRVYLSDLMCTVRVFAP